MWRALRNTTSRGRFNVAVMRLRREWGRVFRLSSLVLRAMMLPLDALAHLRYLPPPPAPPVAPAFLTFFLMTSSAYLMPLPLYGSGGRSSRIFAAVCPRTSRSDEVRTTLFFSTLAPTPFGSLNTTGWE